MKDITDYFTSPTLKNKTVEDITLEPNTSKRNLLNNDENKLSNGKIEDESSSLSNLENKKIKKHKKKIRKHQIKRKPDPLINNITELLSSSLSIISPNTTLNTTLKPIEIVDDNGESNDQNRSKTNGNENDEPQKKINIMLDDSSSETSNIPRNSINAFQFMMEQRKKSIGENSPGKEFQEDSIDDENEKKRLKARKSLFENWAEKKGAAKRRREEEELDETIDFKLKKRAKRLKKMLNVKEKSSNSKKRKTNLIKINNSSNDSINILEENAQDNILVSPDLKNKEKTERTLLNFCGVVEKQSKKTQKKLSLSLKTDKLFVTDKEKGIIGELKKEKPFEKNKDDSTIISSANNLIKKSSNKRKSKLRLLDDSSQSQDSTLTPRTRSWKMKIKINTNNELPKNTNKFNLNESLTNKNKKTFIKHELFSDESLTENSRSNHGKIKVKSFENEGIVLSSEDENEEPKKTKRVSGKIAPVFVKSLPKPKPNADALEARKQFLMSGVPQSIKKTMERQQSIEDINYDVFPSVSHVQQKSSTETFWELPKATLNLKLSSPFKLAPSSLLCCGLTSKYTEPNLNFDREVEKVDNLKTLLNKIKEENPNYPVYRSFRQIYKKSGNKLNENKTPTPKKRGRKKKILDKSVVIGEDTPKTSESPSENAMWTEKYKARCSEDILGNFGAVNSLKKWLETWKNFSQEINSKKRRRNTSTSESEFDLTDGDSRDSSRLPGNTMVLGGPSGSGKSMAVYAICNELGYNVIELNASSKRTGKRLLQELQEATRSHQVRKKESFNVLFNKNKKPTNSKEEEESKMCILLIEDVDIVFEQDDGFISALNHLVSTSKRPVILTATDYNSVSIQKLANQHECITFLPLSALNLATWLRILCLVEGLYVNEADLTSLLEYNKGDARRTILQLQFWTLTGGQLNSFAYPLKLETKNLNKFKEKIVDVDLNELKLAAKENNQQIKNVLHSKCLGSFEIFRGDKTFNVPFYLNLGLIWWNLPNIINYLPSYARNRIEKELKVEKSIKNIESDNFFKVKLKNITNLLDSLALSDILLKKVKYFNDDEPTVQNNGSFVKDSLSLNESFENYDGYLDLTHDITHYLVDESIEVCNRFNGYKSEINMAVPDANERRWRAKQHVCEDLFRDAMLHSSCLERKSVALDYLPTFRNISRSEKIRFENNTKRGNRFRSYLKDLNVNCNDNSLKLVCKIFSDQN